LNKKDYIPFPYRYKLFARSRGLCNLCKSEVILEKEDKEPYTIAEIAHICGEKPKAARYDKNMSKKERSSYENLILLCSSCHTKIDKNEDDYTSKFLLNLKKEHEQKTIQSIRAELQNINFDELEVIIKYLSKTAPIISEEGKITLIPPRDKIDRNDLSPEVNSLIIQGMAKVNLVSDYLNQNPDIMFSDRLKMGFVEKYDELKSKNLTSDEIFYALLEFSKGKNNSPINFASGLTVLTYFFEKCDVFET
jgi:hypothetical protein